MRKISTPAVASRKARRPHDKVTRFLHVIKSVIATGPDNERQTRTTCECTCDFLRHLFALAGVAIAFGPTRIVLSHINLCNLQNYPTWGTRHIVLQKSNWKLCKVGGESFVFQVTSRKRIIDAPLPSPPFIKCSDPKTFDYMRYLFKIP